MPIAKVRLPDGRIGRFNVPEGTTPEQVLEFAKQGLPAQQPAEPPAPPPTGFGSMAVTSSIPQEMSQAMGAGPEMAEAGRRISERGVSIGESTAAARRGEIGGFQLPVQVAGQVAGGALDLMGSAMLGPLQAATRVTPESIKEPVGEAVSGAFTTLAETPVGKAGLEAVKAGVDRWSEFKAANPQEAKTIESAANIGLLAFPVSKKALSGRAAKLERKAAAMTRGQRDKFVHDLVLPKPTPKVLTEQAARTKEKGKFLRQKVVSLSKRERLIFDEVKRVKGLNPRRSVQHNRNAIGKQLDVLARNLEDAVGKKRIIVLKTNVTDQITKNMDDLLKTNPLVASDKSFVNMMDSIKRNASRILDKHPQTPRGILQARREFDGWARKIRKSTFDDTTTNTFKEAVKSTRNAMNDAVDKSIPSAGVRTSLKRQNLLFDALENIDPKAAAEGSNAIVRTFNKLTQVGPARTKAVQALGTVTGLGVIGASATFSTPLAVGLGIGAITYAGRKALMSPTTKRGVAKLLRGLDKILPTTKNPSVLRQLRADRAVIVEMLKNTELIEESNGNEVQQ